MPTAKEKREAAEREAAEAAEREAAASGDGEGGDTSDDAEKFIKFKAHNGTRVIEAKDWKSVGVDDQGKAVWDKRNAWRLPASEFSPKALNYLLQVDGEFVEEK